jgi:hypothetical protein
MSLLSQVVNVKASSVSQLLWLHECSFCIISGSSLGFSAKFQLALSSTRPNCSSEIQITLA